MSEARDSVNIDAPPENRLEAGGGGTRFTSANAFKTPLGALGVVAAGALMGGPPEREAPASPARLTTLAEGER